MMATQNAGLYRVQRIYPEAENDCDCPNLAQQPFRFSCDSLRPTISSGRPHVFGHIPSSLCSFEHRRLRRKAHLKSLCLWLDLVLRKLDGSRANERKMLGAEMAKYGNYLGQFGSVPDSAKIKSYFHSARKFGIWAPDEVNINRAEK